MNKRLLYLLLFFFLLTNCQTEIEEPLPEKPYTSNLNALFSSLPADQTGIQFSNQITDQKDFNILNYRNFYNGGGVALGDVNNDGFVDIYFTANLAKNKLYLNKGNFQFEDITDIADVGGTKAWSTGVSMTDVNADGWLDIYVCNSGDISGDNKANELFLNQKDGTFKEVAKSWGLADQGYSTHASFFDYDQDGDLDCYLLNNSFKSPDKIELYQKSRLAKDQEGGDKLFRNDGNTFTNVTTEAGIYSSDIGFGLGVSISDLNGDMLPDIYVSNDFWERDYLYRNLGGGKFIEELETRLAYTSLNSMGADIGDLNNDGHPEIMTTDMLPADNFRRKSMTQFDPYRLVEQKKEAGYYYQMLQNALHINKGNGDFQEVAYHSGVAATDWSWGTLFFDFNNNGYKDIFVSNGIHRDLTDFDFISFIKDEENVQKIATENARADFRDYLPHMPSTKLSNYAFLNDGNARFSNHSTDLGLDEPSFSNGAAYGDLDNDGDLDLVVNNVNMTAFVYKNKTNEKDGNQFLKITFQGNNKNPFGIGAKVMLTTDGFQQEYQHFLSRGFQSSVSPGLVVGLGSTKEIAELKVIWADKSQQTLTKVAANQILVLKQTDATAKFIRATRNTGKTLFKENTPSSIAKAAFHKENKFDDFDTELLLPHQLSKLSPKILTADVNGDELDDFLLLGAADDPNKLFIQTNNGAFESPFQEGIFFDQKMEATCGAFFDFDRDKDLDLLIGHGGNEYAKGRANFGLRFYENDGKGQFKHEFDKSPLAGGNLSCIVPGDLNKDGFTDLFIGGHCVPGNYGLIPASFVVMNNRDGGWLNSTSPEIGQLGMVTGGQWSDIDGNNNLDLLVVGEWMPITLFKTKDGELLPKETIPNSGGWWQTIEAADLDEDGDTDFVLGNWGENSFFQASTEKPMTMHVNDFDENGKSEFVIESWREGSQKAFPFASKMDLTAQLPHLKKKNLKYKDYAKRTYEQLFTVEERASAKTFTINTLKSAILWNDPNGLRLEALPEEAQLAPVFAIHIADMDHDGFQDILLMGNLYGLKPEVGRQDANRGLLLKGDGKGGFVELSTELTGINVKGEIRDIKTLKRANGNELLLIGRNNAPVLGFEQN